jgi:hypothetical protein
VTLPASAFTGGSGLYGIGIIQESSSTINTYGEFTPILIGPARPATRPAAPTFAHGAHAATVTRAAPKFTLHYAVPGRAAATLEISAPAPTVYGAINTFTNANGDVRDADGFTSGSVVYRRLSSTHGTVTLDALHLGLGTSTLYNVRVVGSGQASPSSLLEVDDRVAPGGDVIDSFGIAGRSSVVAVHDASGGALLRYDATDETWGPALARSADHYEVVGVDPAASRVVTLAYDADTTSVLTFDLHSGRLVGRYEVGVDYTLFGGRVGPARHQAAFLVRRTSDNADLVLPLDVRTGTAGALLATGQTRRYQTIDLDAATGRFYLAHLGAGPGCFTAAAANVAAVDLSAGTVAPSGSLSNCAAFFAAGTTDLYQAVYRSFSVNLVGSLTLQPLDAATMTVSGDPVALRQQFPLGLTVDPAHGVALVPFPTPAPQAVFGFPNGVLTDSNATAQIQESDGAVLKGFAFTDGLSGGYDNETNRGLQLDPATRTGWTFGPGARQIRRFTY